MQREKTKFMTGAAMDVPSGILYFKKLMMKANVDSRPWPPTYATTSDHWIHTCTQQPTATYRPSMIAFVTNWLPSQLVVRLPMTSSTACSTHMQEWIVRNSEISSRMLDGTGNAIVAIMTLRSSFLLS
jgi:hypothetical protein